MRFAISIWIIHDPQFSSAGIIGGAGNAYCIYMILACYLTPWAGAGELEGRDNSGKNLENKCIAKFQACSKQSYKVTNSDASLRKELASLRKEPPGKAKPHWSEHPEKFQAKPFCFEQIFRKMKSEMKMSEIKK